jgi:hypothetical protein
LIQAVTIVVINEGTVTKQSKLPALRLSEILEFMFFLFGGIIFARIFLGTSSNSRISAHHNSIKKLTLIITHKIANI